RGTPAGPARPGHPGPPARPAGRTPQPRRSPLGPRPRGVGPPPARHRAGLTATTSTGSAGVLISRWSAWANGRQGRRRAASEDPLAEAPMEPTVPTTQRVFMETLRRRRADLHESIIGLEHALAAPAPTRLGAWTQRVHNALEELSTDFRDHIDITEGPGGLYPAVLAAAPRLSNAL